jgi:hypothetical protein
MTDADEIINAVIARTFMARPVPGGDLQAFVDFAHDLLAATTPGDLPLLGSVVQLASGGPVMTVIAHVDGDGAEGSPACSCAYFDANHGFRTVGLPPHALVEGSQVAAAPVRGTALGETPHALVARVSKLAPRDTAPRPACDKPHPATEIMVTEGLRFLKSNVFQSAFDGEYIAALYKAMEKARCPDA